MKKYNKVNCTSVVRARFQDKWQRTITLMGTHAFEYTIYIEGITTTSIEKFSTRALAIKKFNELKKKR